MVEWADMEERVSERVSDDSPIPVEDDDDWMLGGMLGDGLAEWGERERRMGGGSLIPGIVEVSISIFSHTALRSRRCFLWLYSNISIQ
jgi:hypothetical protein